LKIGKIVEFVDDFPRTITGKVEKLKLKERAENEYKNGF